MSDVAMVILVLGAAWLIAAVASVFVLQSIVQRLTEHMDDTLDSMNKLAQIGFIHAKAKSAEQAVTQQVVLETAQADIERELEKEAAQPAPPPKQPRGFTGTDGKFYAFMSTPSSYLLARIPPERLVY